MDIQCFKQAEKATTVEELIALIKEHNFPFTDEQAQAYFDQTHKKGTLSDEELNNVTGGACADQSKGNKQAPVDYLRYLSPCDQWKCKNCGTETYQKLTFDQGGGLGCRHCKLPVRCTNCTHVNACIERVKKINSCL